MSICSTSPRGARGATSSVGARGPPSLTLQEFCADLRIGEWLARDMIRKGEIKFFRVRNKIIRIPSEERDRLIQSAESNTLPPAA